MIGSDHQNIVISHPFHKGSQLTVKCCRRLCIAFPIVPVSEERLDQMQDPELSIEQAMMDYKRLGYSDSWINQRLKSIEIRKDLTDEWKKHNLPIL